MSKTCPYHNNPVPCKICGYTGETGEPSNHKSRKANDVLYNRLMMFVACVSECNRHFATVNSEKNFEATKALYPYRLPFDSKHSDLDDRSRNRTIERRNKYIGCVMHCFKNLEADGVSVDDIMTSPANPIIRSVLPDFELILEKYNDRKPTNVWGQLDETKQQLYLRKYNEAWDHSNQGNFAMAPNRRFSGDVPTYGQQQRNRNHNHHLVESEKAFEKGKARRQSKTWKGGKKRKTNKRKVKKKRKNKSRRKKK